MRESIRQQSGMAAFGSENAESCRSREMELLTATCRIGRSELHATTQKLTLMQHG